MSSLVPFTPGHVATAAVDVVPLQDYVAREAISHIDLLKIDVEGYERSVLEGFGWSPRPRMLILEFEDDKTVPLGYSWTDLADALVERGTGSSFPSGTRSRSMGASIAGARCTPIPRSYPTQRGGETFWRCPRGIRFAATQHAHPRRYLSLAVRGQAWSVACQGALRRGSHARRLMADSG